MSSVHSQSVPSSLPAYIDTSRSTRSKIEESSTPSGVTFDLTATRGILRRASNTTKDIARGVQRRVSTGADEQLERKIPEDSQSGSEETREGFKQVTATDLGSNSGRPFSPFRFISEKTGNLVHDKRWHYMTILLIILYALLMGVGTFPFIRNNAYNTEIINELDLAFLILFTIELAIYFLHYGYTLFFDPWLVFDFLIVVVGWIFDGGQIFRATRIFRALKLINQVEDMKQMVVTIGNVVPQMFNLACLMAVLFYIFGIMFTGLYRDEDPEHFESLELTMFTLFQMMTLEWAPIARRLMEDNHYSWMPVLSYVSVSAFLVYNMTVGVICEAVKVQGHVRTGPSDVEKLSMQVAQLQEAQDALQDSLEDLILQLRDLNFLGVVKKSQSDDDLVSLASGRVTKTSSRMWPR